MTTRLSDKALATIKKIPDHEVFGRVTKVLGLLVEIAGFGENLAIGSVCISILLGVSVFRVK